LSENISREREQNTEINKNKVRGEKQMKGYPILFSALVILISFSLKAQKKKPFKLPDTGQYTNYASTDGEDADFFINPLSFTDNGDGTITDNNTCLMWQKTDGGEMTFESAATYCDNLLLGGYSDWRLPTAIELFSINNYR